MIDARKAAGITNTSSYKTEINNKSYYTNVIDGTDSKKLAVSLGNSADDAARFLTGYTKILSGYHYAYFLSNNAETPFVDMPTGTYDKDFNVTLTAVSANSGAQLVYTLDGTDPSASNGTKVASGAKITVSPGSTLTVGLLVNGAVTKTITREYSKAKGFEPKTITIYVNVDKVNWTSPVNFHSWGLAATPGTSWPGTKVSATKTIGDKTWYYTTYTLTTPTDAVSLVFSTGNGAPQTVDVNNASTDKFYEISTSMTGGKYNVDDVTSQYSSSTGIKGVTVSKPASGDNAWYTLTGMRLTSQPRQSGIYIHNGKKVVLRR